MSPIPDRLVPITERKYVLTMQWCQYVCIYELQN